MNPRIGNRSNYYKKGKPPVPATYRKHVNWQTRWANAATDGFDNERSRGIIRLPDPGKCHNCGEKIINGSRPQTKREEE